MDLRGFTDGEKRWVRTKWVRIRKSQQIADASGNKWNALNGELNRYLDESGIIDPVQRAKIKGESLALSDALETGKWHAAESQRHIDDLQLYLKLKEMGLL